jgi:hypothetical protein
MDTTLLIFALLLSVSFAHIRRIQRADTIHSPCVLLPVRTLLS